MSGVEGEKDPLVRNGRDGNIPPRDALFDSSILRTPHMKYMFLLFVTSVIGIVVISFVLSIVQGVRHGAIYTLLGISEISIAMVLMMLIYLMKKDEISRDKMWYIFLFGFCLFIEGVLTTVVLYSDI